MVVVGVVDSTGGKSPRDLLHNYVDTVKTIVLHT